VVGIAVLLSAASAGFAVARWLRLPVIPMLLVAGFALSALGLMPTAILAETVVLGVTILLFVAGIELNSSRVGHQRRAALWVGLWQFAVLGIAGGAAGWLLGYSLQAILYLALAVSASSTLVVVQLLQSRQQLFEPFGRLVVGVLLLQDLLVVLLIPVVARLPDGGGAMTRGVAGVAVLMGLAWVCQRWVAPALVERLVTDRETRLIAMLALLFVFLGLAHLLELPLVAGAFLAGLGLSRFPAGGELRAQLRSISDFFLALLFTALGGLVGLPSLRALGEALALTLLVVVVTPPLVTVVAERFGLSSRAAIEGGLLLAQTSELSLVVGFHALELGFIGERLFTTLVLVTALTMTATPLVANDRTARWLMRLHPSRRRPPPATAPSGHVLLLGCGDNGMVVLETLQIFGHEVVVIDDDPVVVERLQEAEVPCLRGEASDPQLLLSAGAERARLILSTLRRARDNEEVLRHARGVPTLVRVFDAAEAERVRRLGGQPVLLADAAVDELLATLERQGLLPAAPPA
jgi:Kef-type K+ transport system membrane component KefB